MKALIRFTMTCLTLTVLVANGLQAETASQWLTRLRSSDEQIRDSAAYDIELIHPSRENVKTLIAALGDRSLRVRRYVIHTLGEFAATNEGEVFRSDIAKAIAPSLRNYDQRVRAHAVTALAKCGSGAGKVLVGMLEDTRVVDRPGYLGLYLEDRENMDGVLVKGTTKNSPAAQAGLRSGDILISYDRKYLHSRADVVSLSTFSKPADHVELKIRRNGQDIHRIIRVGHRKEGKKDSLWREQSMRVCEQVTVAMARLSPADIPSLDRRLQSKHSMVRRCALTLTQGRPDALMVYRRALYDKEPLVREVARQSIARVGPEGLPAAFDLLLSQQKFASNAEEGYSSWVQTTVLDSNFSQFDHRVIPLLNHAKQNGIGNPNLVAMLLADAEQNREQTASDTREWKNASTAGPYPEGDQPKPWSIDKIDQGLSHPSCFVRLEALSKATPDAINRSLHRKVLVQTIHESPLVRFAAAKRAIQFDTEDAQSRLLVMKALLDGRIEQDVRDDLESLREWLNPCVLSFESCECHATADEPRNSKGPIEPYYGGGVPCSAEDKKPEDGFWPPPRKMAAWNMLKVAEAHPSAKTLNDVYDWLDDDVGGSGFEDCAILPAPHGFALLTPLERVHSDGAHKGASYRGIHGNEHRWTRQKLSAGSLWDYFDHLLYAKPGTHRMFAFIVTDKDSLDKNKKQVMPASDLITAQLNETRILPDKIGKIPVDGHFIHVLVYQFERRMGGRFDVCQTASDVPCHVQLSTFQHLRLANLHGVAHNLK